MAEPGGYAIQPTAPQATEQYSDIALTGLFNAHANQISSERQAIWQRYNVMLIGNVVIFGFLGGGGRTKSEVLVGATFGILLCATWWVITVSGWHLLTMRIERALQFQWPGLDERANPFEVSVAYGRGSIGGMIYYLAIFVIVLFIMGYMLILAGLMRP